MSQSDPIKREVDAKLAIVRRILIANHLSAVRFRGSDWFAWGTAGASNVVLLTTDSGIAELIIARDCAYVMTDNIEAERLEEEEIRGSYPVFKSAWQEPDRREAFVDDLTHGAAIASDLPRGKDLPLPMELIQAKRIMQASEIDRYRVLARDAAEAMTETLKEARPTWTGFELAARGSEALWRRGIQPALTLVGDERRLPKYRHATASADALGERAMLVFCARRHGLFANLTRFVYFREPTSRELQMKQDLAEIEAEILDASLPGRSLGEMYEIMRRTYERFGYVGEIDKHHQGGPCSYLAREDLARPFNENRIARGMALAWNPSLVACKIEDTVLVTDSGLEILTVDPSWPSYSVGGRMRPDYLVRT